MRAHVGVTFQASDLDVWMVPRRDPSDKPFASVQLGNDASLLVHTSADAAAFIRLMQRTQALLQEHGL